MAISKKRRLSYSFLTFKTEKDDNQDPESIYAIAFNSEKEIKDFKDLSKRIEDDPDPIISSAYDALERLSETYDYKLNSLKRFENQISKDENPAEWEKRVLKKKQYDVEILESLIKEVFYFVDNHRKENKP